MKKIRRELFTLLKEKFLIEETSHVYLIIVTLFQIVRAIYKEIVHRRKIIVQSQRKVYLYLMAYRIWKETIQSKAPTIRDRFRLSTKMTVQTAAQLLQDKVKSRSVTMVGIFLKATVKPKVIMIKFSRSYILSICLKLIQVSKIYWKTIEFYECNQSLRLMMANEWDEHITSILRAISTKHQITPRQENAISLKFLEYFFFNLSKLKADFIKEMLRNRRSVFGFDCVEYRVIRTLFPADQTHFTE